MVNTQSVLLNSQFVSSSTSKSSDSSNFASGAGFDIDILKSSGSFVVNIREEKKKNQNKKK